MATVRDTLEDADVGGPISVAYLVYRFDVGGLERCVARLCEHLNRLQFRPMVICLEKSGAAADWITRPDVEIVELHKKPRNELGVARRLARILKEKRVHIVHSHNWGTLVETTVARRLAGVPVHVHTEHGQGLHEGLRGLRRWLRRRVRRWALERTDMVAVCAESVRPLIHRQCGLALERMLFLPNGVERPSCRAGVSALLRTQLGIAEAARVIGSVGRLVPVKQFSTAIDMVAELVSQSRDVHLVLVGDGPEKPKLRERAAQRQLSNRVHLVGWQDNVGDWLGLMDLYINTSRSEAMSMGILEAMAVGRPLVVTDVGDNAALVGADRPCGIIVQRDDATAIASAVTRLLEDPQLRHEMARRARQRYETTYSISCMAARHEDLYQRLLRRTRGGRADRCDNADRICPQQVANAISTSERDD